MSSVSLTDWLIQRPEDFGDEFPISKARQGCGTAALQESMGLNTWGQSVERVALVNILREFLRDRLGEDLKGEFIDRSIWYLSEEPIISYLIARMSWAPSGIKPELEMEHNLRSFVNRFLSTGKLVSYTQDWIRQQSRGW